jgi:hypothetical protein
LSFTRSSTSERGYELLSKAFDRLTGTRMRATFESTKDRDGSRRWVGLLDDVEIITRGAKNRMCAIRIKVSDTTFNAAKAMDVLTIPGDYFGLRSAIAKRIYELCRKHCGDQGQWKIGLALLQKKVEAPRPKRSFAPGQGAGRGRQLARLLHDLPARRRRGVVLQQVRRRQSGLAQSHAQRYQEATQGQGRTRA